MMANTSGLTKQDYLIKRALCEDITVRPSSRILKYVSEYLEALTKNLKDITHDIKDTDIIEEIKYIVSLISKL